MFYTLNLVDDIGSFLGTIGDAINSIKESLMNFASIFETIINMIPEPFRTILITLSVIVIGLIVVKIIGIFL